MNKAQGHFKAWAKCHSSPFAAKPIKFGILTNSKRPLTLYQHDHSVVIVPPKPTCPLQRFCIFGRFSDRGPKVKLTMTSNELQYKSLLNDSLQVDIKMDHMGKEVDLVKQAQDKPSSVNLIYSLRWRVKYMSICLIGRIFVNLATEPNCKSF